jgi:hypothetical protein
MSARLFRRLVFSLIALALGISAAESAAATTIAGMPTDRLTLQSASNRTAPAQAAQPQTTRPYRVVLQVGHYKNNELPPQLSSLSGHTGAAGGGRTELELNLDVSARVAAALRARGVLVEIIPSTVPTGLTADAFIALHADGNGSRTTRGFKISTRWRSEVAQQDGMLVHALTDAYAAATGLPEDGGVTRNMRGYYAYSSWHPNYRISNLTPGAIVEMGFVTSAADRAVMYGQTDKVASGITTGILSFLNAAYGSPATTRNYGYGHGLVDPDINPDAPWLRPRGPGTGGNNGNNGTPSPNSSTGQPGDWQVYLIGRSTVNVYAAPGGGPVLTTLPRDTFYHSTLRKGDYYRIDLPNGTQGWVHRNTIVVQT